MRLIDADKLKSVFNYLCEQKNVGTITLEAVEAIIDTAPTVPQWIQCSERLPELRHDVLICVYFHEGWQVKLGYRQDGEFMFWHEGILDSVLDEEKRVTAWMPLPEPYKANM